MSKCVRIKRKRRAVKISPSLRAKRELMKFLRGSGVIYTNKETVLRLGHFVIILTDCGYVQAYAPTPAAYRGTVTDRVTHVQFPFDNVGQVLRKLEKWHYALFRVPLTKRVPVQGFLIETSRRKAV
jgi:hypothetical protein